jgi:hypothetical protein
MDDQVDGEPLVRPETVSGLDAVLRIFLFSLAVLVLIHASWKPLPLTSHSCILSFTSQPITAIIRTNWIAILRRIVDPVLFNIANKTIHEKMPREPKHGTIAIAAWPGYFEAFA